MTSGLIPDDPRLLGWLYILSYAIAWFWVTSSKAWLVFASALTLAFFWCTCHLPNGTENEVPPIAYLVLVFHCLTTYLSVLGGAR